MSLARPRVADQQHVLPPLQVMAARVSRTSGLLADGWARKSKSSSVLTVGNLAAFSRRSAARRSRSSNSSSQNCSRNPRWSTLSPAHGPPSRTRQQDRQQARGWCLSSTRALRLDLLHGGPSSTSAGRPSGPAPDADGLEVQARPGGTARRLLAPVLQDRRIASALVAPMPRAYSTACAQLRHRGGLQQPQHLDELPRPGAPSSPPGAAAGPRSSRAPASPPGAGEVQRPGLALQQGQVVHRVEVDLLLGPAGAGAGPPPRRPTTSRTSSMPPTTVTAWWARSVGTE